MALVPKGLGPGAQGVEEHEAANPQRLMSICNVPCREQCRIIPDTAAAATAAAAAGVLGWHLSSVLVVHGTEGVLDWQACCSPQNGQPCFKDTQRGSAVDEVHGLGAGDAAYCSSNTVTAAASQQ